jgi:hypothetical protein
MTRERIVAATAVDLLSTVILGRTRCGCVDVACQGVRRDREIIAP